MIIEQTFQNISQFSQRTTLANGIPSMNVVDVQRTQGVEYSCDNGDTVRGTVKTDYSTGREVYSGTINGQTASCFIDYNVILPLTITDEDSIESLLLVYGDGSGVGVVSENCPNDDRVAVTAILDNSCDATVIRNFIVTDDNGVEHRLANRLTLDFN